MFRFLWNTNLGIKAKQNENIELNFLTYAPKNTYFLYNKTRIKIIKNYIDLFFIILNITLLLFEPSYIVINP